MKDPAWLICIGSFSAAQHQDLRDLSWPVVVLESTVRPAEDVAACRAEQPGPLFLRQNVHVCGDQQELAWYSYNDNRQDGYLSPRELLPSNPNLCLLEQRLVRGERFDRLIDAWLGSQPELAELLAAEGGALWLQTSQPKPVIAGMGNWLTRFTDLYWTPRGSLQVARQRVDAEFAVLDQQGYFLLDAMLATVPGTTSEALHWGIDHQRLLEDRCRDQADTITKLSTDLERLEDSLEHWNCVAEELAAERDDLGADGDCLRQQVEQLNDHLQLVSRQRDELQELLGQLQQQGAAVESRIDELMELVSAQVPEELID